METKNSNSEKGEEFLKHHGVLGMKWGIRRYQPYPKGSKRKGIFKGRNKKPHKIPEKKGVRRGKLEAKYIKQGLNKHDAEQRAAGRIKTEKILAGVVATATVAGALVVLKRKNDKFKTGVNLKKGSIMSHIQEDVFKEGLDLKKDKRLFVSFDKADKVIYKSTFVDKHLNKLGSKSKSIKDVTLKAKTDLKAPSTNEAKKLFEKFTQDYDGKFRSYDQLMQGMYTNNDLSKAWVKELKKKGFNSMIDYNDQTSFIGAHKPLIVFESGKMLEKVTSSGVNSYKSKAVSDTIEAARWLKEPVNAASVGTGMAAAGAYNSFNNNNKHGAVNLYMANNPKTKKTYGEIYNNLERTSGKYTFKYSYNK